MEYYERGEGEAKGVERVEFLKRFVFVNRREEGQVLLAAPALLWFYARELLPLAVVVVKFDCSRDDCSRHKTGKLHH